MMYGLRFGNGYEYMRGGMVLMMFFGLIIIAAVIYFVIKGNSRQSHSQNHANTSINSNRALDILNEKLANGEISEDEYSSKKKMINGR
jgi:putative membrane protein